MRDTKAEGAIRIRVRTQRVAFPIQAAEKNATTRLINA